MADAHNPIQSVTPVDEDGNVLGTMVTNLIAPSTYEWGQYDISSSKAGRVQSMKMKKMRLGRARGIKLSWKNVTFSDVAAILQAFDPEYVLVKYRDAKSGGFEEKVFYVGDRISPMLNATLTRWESVGFTITQQMPDEG